MKLYEITKSLLSLWDQASEVLDDGNRDQTEQLAALIYLENHLKTLEGTHAEKCLDIACLIKNTEADAEALKAEEQKLAARRKAAERKADWLRDYLQSNMEPGTNLKDARAVIGWRKSTVCEVGVNASLLPVEFQRTKAVIEADKSAIKTSLEAGAEVPGCELVTKYHLQLK